MYDAARASAFNLGGLLRRKDEAIPESASARKAWKKARYSKKKDTMQQVVTLKAGLRLCNIQESPLYLFKETLSIVSSQNK